MQSQLEYQISLDNISDIVFSLDLPGNIHYINRAVEGILGYQVEDLIGQHISKILSPESWQEVQRFFQLYIRHNREVTAPLTFIRNDGAPVILETKALPITQEGRIVAIQGTCRDITEKVQLEQQLKQEKWQTQILYDISAILNLPLELKDLLQRCLDKLCDYLAVPIGHIRSFDLEAGTAQLVVARGLSERYVRTEESTPIRLYDSLFYTQLSQGNPVIIENYEEDGSLPRKKLLEEGVKSAIFIPIKSREKKTLGILTLASKEYRSFRASILPLLEAVTTQIGLAMERHMLQQNLIRTKEKYQNMFNYANDYIYVIDLDGYFIEANLAAKEFIGYLPGERVHLRDFIPPDKPEELIKVENIIKQLLEGKITQASFEQEIINREGQRAILETRGVLLRDPAGNPIAFQGISRDITQRKKLEREISEARKFLTNILEQMLDLVIVTDPQGIITFFNSRVKKVFQYETKDLLGQPIWKFYPRGKKEARKIMASLMKQGRIANYELDLVDKTGRIVPLLISIVLLRNEEGKITGTLGVAKDLTEKKALERQIIQSEKLASLGRLTAGAAHEIFNPMQIILGISQLLMKREGIDPYVVDQLKRIESQVRRVTNIINGMLQFSRTISEERDLIDLNVTLKEALSLVDYELPKAGIEVSLDISPSPLMIFGNKADLIQLFVNLLINAKDAMPQGGRILVKTSRHEDQGLSWARATVTDTGVGIPPDIMAKIFDPFFTTKEVGKGTGLGLAICYGIVERHEGHISVESQPGQGTTFTIDLPLIVEGAKP